MSIRILTLLDRGSRDSTRSSAVYSDERTSNCQSNGPCSWRTISETRQDGISLPGPNELTRSIIRLDTYDNYEAMSSYNKTTMHVCKAKDVSRYAASSMPVIKTGVFEKIRFFCKVCNEIYIPIHRSSMLSCIKITLRIFQVNLLTQTWPFS